MRYMVFGLFVNAEHNSMISLALAHNSLQQNTGEFYMFYTSFDVIRQAEQESETSFLPNTYQLEGSEENSMRSVIPMLYIVSIDFSIAESKSVVTFTPASLSLQ